jgi:hypothetical protein
MSHHDRTVQTTEPTALMPRPRAHPEKALSTWNGTAGHTKPEAQTSHLSLSTWPCGAGPGAEQADMCG